MCEYCLQLDCPEGCPNWNTPRAVFQCSICGDNICVGDKYIMNDNDEIAHIDCFYSNEDLLRWVEHEIKVVEDYEE